MSKYGVYHEEMWEAYMEVFDSLVEAHACVRKWEEQRTPKGHPINVTLVEVISTHEEGKLRPGAWTVSMLRNHTGRCTGWTVSDLELHMQQMDETGKSPLIYVSVEDAHRAAKYLNHQRRLTQEALRK